MLIGKTFETYQSRFARSAPNQLYIYKYYSRKKEHGATSTKTEVGNYTNEVRERILVHEKDPHSLWPVLSNVSGVSQEEIDPKEFDSLPTQLQVITLYMYWR